MEESELIDKYLKGELDESELTSLEERMTSDQIFRSKVELRKVILKSIHQAYQDELRTKLKHIDQKLDRQINPQKMLMIAASISILVIIGIGFYIFQESQRFSKISSFDLYDQGIPNKMGLSNNKNFDEAMNYFKESNYEDALALINLSNHQSDTSFYYAGICSFRLGRSNEAVNYLKKINSESEFYFKAKYRLGLVYWKLNNLDAAIMEFSVASKDSSEYGDKAKQILFEF